MGPVSAAGFADSRGGKGPEAETYSPRTRRAQNAAAHEAEGRARAQGHEAAKVAAAEARRRGERLRLATADAAEVAMEDAGVERVAEAAGAWRARDGRAAAGARTVLARVAGRAARRLQRERPAASAASKGKRARAMRDVAQLLVAGGAAVERGEVVNAAAADRGCAAVERLLKARLQEHARGQLRAMVNAVLAAQSTRGEEEVSDVEEAGGEPVAEELAPASEEMSDAGEAGGEPVAEELAPAAARSTPSTNEGCMHPLETPELRKRRLAGEPPPRLERADEARANEFLERLRADAEAPTAGGAAARAARPAAMATATTVRKRSAAAAGIGGGLERAAAATAAGGGVAGASRAWLQPLWQMGQPASEDVTAAETGGEAPPKKKKKLKRGGLNASGRRARDDVEGGGD